MHLNTWSQLKLFGKDEGVWHHSRGVALLQGCGVTAGVWRYCRRCGVTAGDVVSLQGCGITGGGMASLQEVWQHCRGVPSLQRCGVTAGVWHHCRRCSVVGGLPMPFQLAHCFVFMSQDVGSQLVLQDHVSLPDAMPPTTHYPHPLIPHPIIFMDSNPLEP